MNATDIHITLSISAEALSTICRTAGFIIFCVLTSRALMALKGKL
jgi:hypothetical protein